MQGFKKFAKIFAVVIVLLIGAVGAYLYWGSYADGYRVGTLLKISRKGVGFKTWEGELSQGFLEQNVADGGVATKIWYFSVRDSDPTTYDALQRAMEQGARVKLHYHEKYYKIPWIGDTRYIVDQVEVVK